MQIATCIFNKLLGAGLFLALDGTSMCTDPSTNGRKYRKLVNNAVFICTESLFVVSAVAMSAFQLKHMCGCYAAYALQAIKFGLVNMGKYQSCCSMGNTIGVYTMYKCKYHIC